MLDALTHFADGNGAARVRLRRGGRLNRDTSIILQRAAAKPVVIPAQLRHSGEGRNPFALRHTLIADA